MCVGSLLSEADCHRIYCIENVFTIQGFWATCAYLEKESFPSNFSLYWIYFLPFKIFEQLALALKNRECPEFAVLNIYIFIVTCGEVRDWGGTVSFKAKFASVWIEWSSINSPLNRLLAEWLLLMLSSPHHNLLHTYRHNSDSRFEKRWHIGGPSWSDLSTTCLTALLKSWISLTTYAYVQNAIHRSNREWRPSVWSAAAENFNENL